MVERYGVTAGRRSPSCSRKPPSRKDGLHDVATFTLKAAQPHTIVLSAGTGAISKRLPCVDRALRKVNSHRAIQRFHQCQDILRLMRGAERHAEPGAAARDGGVADGGDEES